MRRRVPVTNDTGARAELRKFWLAKAQRWEQLGETSRVELHLARVADIDAGRTVHVPAWLLRPRGMAPTWADSFDHLAVAADGTITRSPIVDAPEKTVDDTITVPIKTFGQSR